MGLLLKVRGVLTGFCSGNPLQVIISIIHQQVQQNVPFIAHCLMPYWIQFHWAEDQRRQYITVHMEIIFLDLKVQWVLKDLQKTG